MSPLLLAAGPLSLNNVEVDVGSAMKAGKLQRRGQFSRSVCRHNPLKNLVFNKTLKGGRSSEGLPVVLIGHSGLGARRGDAAQRKHGPLDFSVCRSMVGQPLLNLFGTWPFDALLAVPVAHEIRKIRARLVGTKANTALAGVGIFFNLIEVGHRILVVANVVQCALRAAVGVIKNYRGVSGGAEPHCRCASITLGVELDCHEVVVGKSGHVEVLPGGGVLNLAPDAPVGVKVNEHGFFLGLRPVQGLGPIGFEFNSLGKGCAERAGYKKSGKKCFHKPKVPIIQQPDRCY